MSDEPDGLEPYHHDAIREVVGLIKTRASARPTLLYHYTDAAGFLGILTTRQLWATNYPHLNDESEIRYAVVQFMNRLEELGAKSPPDSRLSSFLDMIKFVVQFTVDFNDFYVVSFSEIDDDLAQWRAYGGKTDKYCIGFSASELDLHPSST